MSYHRPYVLILTLCIRGLYKVPDYDLEGRIVKGYRVEIYQFPHSAFLQFKKTVPTGCGDSVISANAIISAARCFEELRYRKGNIAVYLGSTVPLNSQAVRPVNSYRLHPRFNPKTGKFNLGVAYLYTTIPFGALYSENTNRNKSAYNYSLFVYQWLG
ncbi:jg4406 [Pararge aegeria aegeria]|uniref:Jg4406 protein n=1 Tax=Pararge aegeria aegeria TaxID=348720 RepID=A0A8S4RJ05_9NEOP|nr:jg4406 [Pararge aegeria aegeria]